MYVGLRMLKTCVIACGVRWGHTEARRWPWSPQRWWSFSWLGAVWWKWWVPTQILWKGRNHFVLLSHLCSSPNLALTMWNKCVSVVCSHCKYIRIVLTVFYIVGVALTICRTLYWMPSALLTFLFMLALKHSVPTALTLRHALPKQSLMWARLCNCPSVLNSVSTMLSLW